MKTKVEKVKSKGVLADYVKKSDMSLYHHLKNRSLIAMKISKALKEAGLSKKEFAQKMGKSPTVITEWLSGQRNFTCDTLTDISLALGINLLDTRIDETNYTNGNVSMPVILKSFYKKEELV